MKRNLHSKCHVPTALAGMILYTKDLGRIIRSDMFAGLLKGT